jgi:glycosyltransferase involved in cell wall biosynthesis
MKISRVYIGASHHDYHLAQCCVASIRHWYPDIPISLIKDFTNPQFDTIELEKAWNVSIFQARHQNLGLGWGKLEAIAASGSERCLILDSDIVLVNPLLDQLEAFDEDFIVVEENHPPESIHSYYFNLPLLQELDPSFQFPGFVFNVGQIVATSGLLTWDDFLPHLRIEPRIEVLHPEIFPGSDQGLLNYLLLKKISRQEISLRRHAFMRWGHNPAYGKMSLHDIARRQSSYTFLIHWAGRKSPDLDEIPHAYLLKFFFKKYHQAVSGGWWKHLLRRLQQKIQARRPHIWKN